MQFYSNFPAFKTQATGFLDKIQSLLAAFPGAAPAPPGTFKDTVDAQEWTTNLLDDTLARVDDAVADAKRANDQKKGGAAVTKDSAAAAAAVATTSGPSAPMAKHRPVTQQGFISYMQSTLQEKPQALFDPPMDNSNVPFVHNFNNIKAYIDVQAAKEAATAALAADQPVPHPLQAQLDALTYPDWQVAVPDTAHQYKLFEETPFAFIDTLSELEAVAARLSQAQEIAVDLEAHNYRSFQGFCCLMQLSTREEDLIIDVIALRAHIGPLLAPIFANPGIVKVLHGSDGDIVWLQRDFGIYMSNLFDTGQAARVLNYPGHGLGYMLDRLCGFKADKRWQLADWRLRPLSDDALHYARADTHYLLHCYDRVRQELAQIGHISAISPHLVVDLPMGNPGGALGTVLERSRQLCLQMYEKELLKKDSFMALYDRINKNFNDEQMSVFCALYEWRDKIARDEDESFGYILSRAQLITLAETRPITVAELSRVLGKGAAQVQRRAKEVLALMALAKRDTKLAKEIREAWREKVGERVFMPGRGRGIEVLPDMAAAAAAAFASIPPPPPPPAPAAAALEVVPQEAITTQQPSTGGLKPRAIKPLNGGPATIGSSGLLGGPAPPAAPAVAGGLKPRAVVPLGGPTSTPNSTTAAPKLAVTGASSLFGSLLSSNGNGISSARLGKLPALGYGAVAPVAAFAAPVATTQQEGVALAGTRAVEKESEIAISKEATAAEKKAAVRAAMNQLAADQAVEDAPEEGEILLEVAPAGEEEPKELEELEDFMPLALSDKYGLKRKKKRQQGQQGLGKPKKQRSEKNIDERTKEIFKELGLEGGPEEEKIEGDGDEDAAEAVDYAAAAAKYDFGIVNPHARRENGGRGRGARGRGRGGGGGGRGRGAGGGGGRGRGGRSKGKGDDDGGTIPEGRFNPYAALDMSGIKGGKRSAVYVRSGNRSAGFK